MDINKLLQGVECSCGKNHCCDIECVYIECGAVERLRGLCADYNSIIFVADENTYSAAGEQVEHVLEHKDVKKVIFSGKKVLIPDENAIQRICAELAGCDLIIGIGSGVIQDLCKYVSFFEKVPYMIAATAPSMDGYASNGAAMILKGMKETVAAGLPKAIIADVDILKNATLEMIKAGYGDIIGKYSALCDWKLGNVVNGEYFCQYIYDATYSMIERTLETAKGLLVRDGNSIRTLMEALVVVGIMMSFAGSSRPASGSEHHLSHFFEITGIVNSEPYFPHGIDVAYSTVVTAEIREKLLNREIPAEQYCPEREEYIAKMKEVYSSVAEGCIALQDKVKSYNTDRMGIYRKKENEIRDILGEMPKSTEIIKLLEFAEISMKDFYEMYEDAKINNAILYAKDLKDRYTVLWMDYDIGNSRLP